MRHSSTLVLALLAAGCASSGYEGPIIDVHLHALPADAEGQPPVMACAPNDAFPAHDPTRAATAPAFESCDRPLVSPATDDELRTRTLALLERHDIVAVTSGRPGDVARWRCASPTRVLAAATWWPGMATDSLRAQIASGAIVALAEIGTQYIGLAPNDAALEPLWTLAEELDVPVGVHMGLARPGLSSLAPGSAYRARLSDPLLLEDVLIRHPRLRVYVMHAGWPMLDEMVHLLYSYQQVHLDVGVISWLLPRAEFHAYLRRLVDAGFADRIMFGSDQGVWPDAIERALDGVLSADFLSADQAGAILHDNAHRFFRLGEERQADGPSGGARVYVTADNAMCR